MKTTIARWALGVLLGLGLTDPSFCQPGVLPNHHEVKHVIFMVPDGMGLADVTATRIRKNGISGAPLAFETLDRIGYERTYSKKNTITDSAAAASAWACGEKFVNNEVCYHMDGAPHNPTLLELAKAQGWGTGLVVTQTVTHATPACFAAHVEAPLTTPPTSPRSCETEIARQYVEETQPDVILGGGTATFKPLNPDPCGVTGDFIAEAITLGWTYVDTKDKMDAAVSNGVTKLLGLFAAKNLTPEFQRLPGTTEPRLPQTTAAALKILEKHSGGFFLIVEGSLVDSGNHAENIDYQYGEMDAFDEAVKVVRAWIDASPERKEHTLLIVVPDHETGGFAIEGTEAPGGEPLGFFVPAWAFPPISPEHPEAHHTGTDQPIWSSGPGSEMLGMAIDNTFVYRIVKEAMQY